MAVQAQYNTVYFSGIPVGVNTPYQDSDIVTYATAPVDKTVSILIEPADKNNRRKTHPLVEFHYKNPNDPMWRVIKVWPVSAGVSLNNSPIDPANFQPLIEDMCQWFLRAYGDKDVQSKFTVVGNMTV